MNLLLNGMLFWDLGISTAKVSSTPEAAWKLKDELEKSLEMMQIVLPHRVI